MAAAVALDAVAFMAIWTGLGLRRTARGRRRRPEIRGSRASKAPIVVQHAANDNFAAA